MVNGVVAFRNCGFDEALELVADVLIGGEGYAERAGLPDDEVEVRLQLLEVKYGAPGRWCEQCLRLLAATRPAWNPLDQRSDD